MIDPPPASIRVGYRTYDIEVWSAMVASAGDRLGECDNLCGTIRIREDLPMVKAGNTMLHEVMHACWYVASLEDDDKQERIVNTLANQLTQVWRDNPELVAWINARLT